MHNVPAIGNLRILATTLVIYMALAQLAFVLSDPVSVGASFWPAAGLTMAALLLLPTRQWVWVIGGIVIGECSGNLLRGYPLSASLFWTLGNCVEPLLGAWLIRRSGNLLGSLTPLGNLLRFMIYGVVVAPLVGASIGSLGTILIMGSPAWQVWPKYVVGDALGVLVMAPVLLSWFDAKPMPRRPLESALLMASVVALCVLAFRNWGHSIDIILTNLLLPLMLWAALRFGVQGTAWVILVIANVANIATGLGYGPFTVVEYASGHGITVLQILLAISSATALVVAALTNDLIQGLHKESRLLHQAHHDTLTGLHNRTGLHYRLEQMQHRRGTDSGALNVLMCDLDEFKDVNDRYGHLTGDRVLEEVARRIKNCIRDADIAARLGGDEFIVVISNSNRETVGSIAARILEAMEQPVGEISITMSIGIANAAMDDDFQESFAAADRALYKAKHIGRNRSVWADSLTT